MSTDILSARLNSRASCYLPSVKRFSFCTHFKIHAILRAHCSANTEMCSVHTQERPFKRFRSATHSLGCVTDARNRHRTMRIIWWGQMFVGSWIFHFAQELNCINFWRIVISSLQGQSNTVILIIQRMHKFQLSHFSSPLRPAACLEFLNEAFVCLNEMCVWCNRLNSMRIWGHINATSPEKSRELWTMFSFSTS